MSKRDRLCSSCATVYYRKRHEADPRVRLFNNARCRASRDRAPFNITLDDVVIPDECPAIGIKLAFGQGVRHSLDSSPSLDRIIPELGYTRGNVVVLSMRANRMKNDARLPELKALVRWLTRQIKPHTL